MDVPLRRVSRAGCPCLQADGLDRDHGVRNGAPNVLENAGVDSERYTGWAFGMGPDRIALARYGIPDIRMLREGDVRVLGQFAGAL
jgi:phenylalanyl-tRNA synthetase alpha chain